MSLPSQSGRPIASGRSSNNMYRRRKSPKPLIIAGGLVLVVGFGAWMVLGRGGDEANTAGGDGGGLNLPLGPQSATAAPPTGNPAQPAGDTFTPHNQQQAQQPAAQPQDPPPFELRQGSPSNATSSTRTADVPLYRPPAPAPAPIPAADLPGSNAGPDTASSGKEGAGLSLAAARERLTTGDLVAARVLFTRALAEAGTENERATIREELTRINEDLVFSPRLIPNDPWSVTYTVQTGDSLSRISQQEGLATDWRLIQRINRMSNPNRLQLGQRLKLLRGPFHAVVSKSAFRLDLYMGPGNRPEQWLFVRSFPVGLGEGGSTPIGTFVVKRNSKLINPHWVNPRTGETFEADNPKNPIGERWIGLEGVGDSMGYTGYGLHGTVEPESIGREMSMGCVRMSDQDVELIYELLGEEVSVVRIDP